MSQGFRDITGNPVTGFEVYTEDGRNCVLLRDYQYERADGCVIPLPKGSTSDGLSIPRGIWNVIPPFGPGWMGGYTHDVGYRNGLPKDFMDETLLEILMFCEVDTFASKIIYEGVHRAGQPSYEEDLKAWKAKYGF
jgi:hypothetical protein